ncbi:MAG TPA: hypothetical protein VET82_02680 [Candidatus Eisenbacteria bacterium]|nr:hypothetical protein [Candidatus Eisenbacteria bacterium]
MEVPRRLFGGARWGLLAPLPLYALLALALFRGAWQAPASAVIGYGPDPPFFVWSLGWFPFALTHGLDPLVSTYLDYPAGINLMGSTSAPLLGLVLGPVTAGWGPLVAYNLAISASLALSAWCAFLLCCRLVRSRVAGAIAGLIYGFSPFMVGHSLGHPHLVAAVFPPLLFLVLHDLVTRPRRHPLRTGALLGLIAAAQFYLSEEVLAMEAVAVLLAVAVGAALFPTEWRRCVIDAVRPMAVGLALGAALIGLPLGVQFFGAQHVVRAVNPGGFYVSDLLGFIIPTHLTWLSPLGAAQLSDRFTGNPAEWGSYVGVPLLGLSVWVSVREWRRPLVRFVALLGLLLALLSLGPTLHLGGMVTMMPTVVLGFAILLARRQIRMLPVLLALVGSWVALAVAPVVSDILPARLMLLVFLLLAILMAVFIDSTRWSIPRQRLGVIVATAAALLALVPATPVASTPFGVPGFFQGTLESRIRQGSVVLVAPYAYAWDDVAMVWQSASGIWFRMPEGYGTVPGPSLNAPSTSLGDLMIDIDRGRPYAGVTVETRERLLADLRRWKVEAVVVGPMAHQDDMVHLFVDLLNRAPESVGGVYLWSPA